MVPSNRLQAKTRLSSAVTLQCTAAKASVDQQADALQICLSVDICRRPCWPLLWAMER